MIGWLCGFLLPSIATPAIAAKPLVVGFSQVGAESEWRSANTRSIKDAAKQAGVTLRFADAQQHQENQVKAIRSFIAQRVDVIAFSPVVESGWETVLREAKAAKIPVILTGGGEFRRSAAVEELHYNKDGTIRFAAQTAGGPGPNPSISISKTHY